MELTLRQALKSRKVRNVNGYYSNEHLVNKAIDINGAQKGWIDLPFLVACEKEKERHDNCEKLVKQGLMDMREVFDGLILQSFLAPLDYPVFVVAHKLAESLSNTSCLNKKLIISRPFIDRGIILMPKKTGIKDISAVYIFSLLEGTCDRGIMVLSLGGQVGARTCEFISLDRLNDHIHENVTGFLVNLLLYQQSIKDKEPSSTELTAIPRGFGAAKNTNQKQIQHWESTYYNNPNLGTLF
jgi:hypothetical protein